MIMATWPRIAPHRKAKALPMKSRAAQVTGKKTELVGTVARRATSPEIFGRGGAKEKKLPSWEALQQKWQEAWMVAGVEEGGSLISVQLNEMYKQSVLTPTQIGNYWDDLWSDGEEVEEEEAEEEEEGEEVEWQPCYPPRLVNLSALWRRMRAARYSISYFIKLFFKLQKKYSRG